MGHPSHPQAAALPSAVSSPWNEVAGLCESLRALSAQVGQSLEQGAGTGVLVPLLRKELELARSLREGIARCAQQPSSAQSKAHRQDLGGQLGSLLETEQTNQNLLKRRGIRLRGSRFPLSRLNCP